jgi:L-2-amino-thiazoline-4-carboxylic acid hydrolase-like protein
MPANCDVRFTLNSGHSLRQSKCLLWANSGHRPRRKWAAMHTAMADITEQDVTVEMLRHDKEALEFDVTRCQFAEFFRALGEPELGALLICETNFDIAAAGSGEVTFTRDRTIMQGAPSCTFRYKFAPR